MLDVPAPARAGVNVLPDMPAPLSVPPTGRPPMLTAAASKHYDGAKPVMLNEGRGLTATVCVAEFEQPLPSL